MTDDVPDLLTEEGWTEAQIRFLQTPVVGWDEAMERFQRWIDIQTQYHKERTNDTETHGL
jgi:hypothetical protein